MHQIKLHPEQIQEGMYIAELDRPWLDSPFPFQGFEVTTKKQIKMLREICSHVFIDSEKGVVPNGSSDVYADAGHELPPDIPPAPLPTDLLHYETEVSFNDEVSATVEIHASLSHEITNFMDAVSSGERPSLRAISDIVLDMRSSMVRNPHAFLYLSRLKTKGAYTYAHAIQCGTFALAFGRHIGLSQDQLHELGLGGLLMDVGKLTLPSTLLSKKGPLTIAEFEVAKQHVAFSEAVLENSDVYTDTIKQMVATHHERFNGTGYPAGLKGGEIPLFGRIAGIVDFFTAVTNVRPYAAAMSPHDAVMHLYEFRNSLFQSELIEYFIQTVGAFPVGTLVELSNGEIGIVLTQNDIVRLKPQVLVILGSDKQPVGISPIRDLITESDDQFGKPLKILQALTPGTYNIDPSEYYL